MVRQVVLACAVAVFGSVTAFGQAGSSAMGGMEMPKPAAAPSTSLTLTVDGKATTFSAADLRQLPQRTVNVHNAHTNAYESYAGVTLSDLLARAGFAVSKATQPKMLHSYLRATGTDKYWVIYSLTEVESSEHAGDVIVAISMNGGKDLGADGELKLVSTEDKKPQRWVRNLTAITLTTVE